MEHDQAASDAPKASNPWSKPPGGGAARPKPLRAKEVVLYVAGVFAAAALVALIVFAAGQDWQGEAGHRKDADKAFRMRVETDVKRELRDPSSASFRDVFYWSETAAACGDVNSKNGFGGFAGFDQFAYHDGRVAFLSDDTDKYFRLMRACRRAQILSAKRDVRETMTVVEASSMDDTEKLRSKDESEQSLSELDNQLADMVNEKL